jgi:hypothetical protein
LSLIGFPKSIKTLEVGLRAPFDCFNSSHFDVCHLYCPSLRSQPCPFSASGKPFDILSLNLQNDVLPSYLEKGKGYRKSYSLLFTHVTAMILNFAASLLTLEYGQKAQDFNSGH